jgi:APA family basic amino acid/polyamine antiporter
MTYAELGVLYPKAGGEYAFLREGLGTFPAFLSGWTAFTINLAGSAAALAVIFAEQLNALKPDGFAHLVLVDTHLGSYHLVIDGIKLTAAALILLLSIVNYFGIKLGGNVQKGFTVAKYGLIVLLAFAGLFFAGQTVTEPSGFFGNNVFDYCAGGSCDAGELPIHHDGFDFAAFLSLGMVAALFAYDGWTNVVRVGGEIRDPQRNLPRAMMIGIGSVMVLYILVSFGYLNVLGFEGFAESQKTVASDAARVIFDQPGSFLATSWLSGEAIVASLILVSVAGSLNGITISGPRVYYAMSRDGLFPKAFAATNRHAVPAHAIWAQAVLSILFLFFFDFNQLTDNVVFISFLFYALAAVGLMVLRRKMPDVPRAYRVPGYPVVPLIFIVASLSFVAYLAYDQFSTLSAQNFSRLAGLLVVAAGIPVYLLYNARQKRAAQDAGTPPSE